MDEMQIPERSRRPFFVSLYQFVSPAVGVDVDGGLRRMMNESVLSVVDKGVYQDLDAPLDSAGLSPEQVSRPPLHGLRCKKVGRVKRPSWTLPPPPPTEQTEEPSSRVQPLRSSAAVKRRTRQTDEGDCST